MENHFMIEKALSSIATLFDQKVSLTSSTFSSLYQEMYMREKERLLP